MEYTGNNTNPNKEWENVKSRTRGKRAATARALARNVKKTSSKSAVSASQTRKKRQPTKQELREQALRELFNENSNSSAATSTPLTEPDELNTLSLANTSANAGLAHEPRQFDAAITKRFQAALVNFFRDGYTKHIGPADDETILKYINNILTRYGIKISGGFVLKNVGEFAGNSGAASIDIDIYVPYYKVPRPAKGRITKDVEAKMRKERTETIHKLLMTIFNVDKARGKPLFRYFKVTMGHSKAAFFTKNGIYSVTKYTGKQGTAEMDLVQADRTTTPEDIIRRFDLTFCQNWYDGEHVWSMDIEAVYKRKPGMLEDSYVPLYLDGNPVTRKRIAKYIKRGFRIEYNDPETGTAVEITLDDLADVRNLV